MSSLRNFIKRLLPLSNPLVIAAVRRTRELRNLPARLRPGFRRQLRQDCERCQNFDELFVFARDRLAGGALQNLSEIKATVACIAEQHPATVCEIGTANGGTNLLLSRSLPSVRTIIGLDLFIMNRPILQALAPAGQRQYFINGSSRSQSVLRRVRSALGSESLDLLFIDGDHRFEGVTSDFVLYSPLVREGGLIMFHDIVPDHGSRFGGPRCNCAGDVPHLWQQLKPHFRHREFIENPEQDGLGLGILYWTKATPLPRLIPPR